MTKKVRRLTLVLAGLALFAFTVGLAAETPETPATTEEPEAPPAPQKINLEGILMNPDTGLPSAGVTLALVDPGEYVATTRADGRFIFRDVPVGVYRFMFAFGSGDNLPAESILLIKNINVKPGLSSDITLQRTLMSEWPETKPLILGDFVFRDGRERKHARRIVLKEPFGRNWPEEYLSVQLQFSPTQCRLPSLRLMSGATGREVPYQLSDVTFSREDLVASCTLTFPASVRPLQNMAYVVCSDWRGGYLPPKYDTDLKVEVREDTGEQVFSNSLIAVRLPPAQGTLGQGDKCPPPIAALRGPDGVWFGEGSIVSEAQVQSFTCAQVEDGPLFKEFKIRYQFAPGKDGSAPPQYEVTVRLYANRDFLIIRESMTGKVDLKFRLSALANFTPDIGLCAEHGQAVFNNLEAAGGEEPVTLAVFRPWNPPGLPQSHNWYGLYNSGDRKDAVGLVKVNGARWAFGDRQSWLDGSWPTTLDDDNEVRLIADSKPDLYFEFPHREGTREFALAVFNKDLNWAPADLDAAEPPQGKSNYLNLLYMQRSHVNLSTLLELKAGRQTLHERPRLLLNSQTFPALKAAFQENPDRFPDTLRDIFSGSRTHTQVIRSQVISSVLALQQAFVGSPGGTIISGVSGNLVDPKRVEPILTNAILLYNANVNSGLFSDLERNVILTTISLLADQLEDGNYWPRYSRSPDVMARRDCALMMTALFLDRHPRSSARLLAARNSMLNRLARAEQTDGLSADIGSLAASINLWARIAPVIENATQSTQIGVSPFSWQPFVKEIERLSTLTTPPDRRYGGARLFPTIGRSPRPVTESPAMMKIAAARSASQDAKSAARLQWVWRQAGMPVFATGEPISALLDAVSLAEAPDPAPQPPDAVGSVALPGFGALMRTGFGGPDEAYLLFKCSPQGVSSHRDQGSLIFYAFGAPLLVDTPSLPERQATWAHNTVRIDSRGHNAPGRIIKFAGQEEDDYVLGEIKVEALSKLREYTPAEFDAVAAAAATTDAPFVPPPGHRADGSETVRVLSSLDKLDTPVLIRRHVLFNKQRQYMVVFDHVEGRLPTDVFFNVLADDARTEGAVTTFAGPFGVDLNIHAFGTQQPATTIQEDVPGRWTLRLSQPAPESPGDASSEEPQPGPPAVVDYVSVICPVRRGGPDGADMAQYAAPTVEKLEGLAGVRISYGKTVRYIFLSDDDTEYNRDGVRFKGTRGILTIRPTHFDVVLFDAGEIRYQGTGVSTDRGMVRLRIIPGGFVEGETDGPREKQLEFHGLDRSPRNLSFLVDGQEFIGEGDSETALYGISAGSHTVTVEPK